MVKISTRVKDSYDIKRSKLIKEIDNFANSSFDNLKEVKINSTSLEIAQSISEGLARKVLAAEINGEVWDLNRPLRENVTLKLLTFNDSDSALSKYISFEIAPFLYASKLSF